MMAILQMDHEGRSRTIYVHGYSLDIRWEQLGHPKYWHVLARSVCREHS